uniref:Vacuolar protein sorting-associated protein 41 homolog n=1 Tax=Ditylenchus dipsaci TaxID=166011 RepID=A0A915D1U2_9BILA
MNNISRSTVEDQLCPDSPSTSVSNQLDLSLREAERTKLSADTTLTLQQELEQDDEEEEVLIEPRFKYSRILNDVSRILEGDPASCIAVHDKFIAIGGLSGRIYLFDHMGNTHMEFTARHHKCAVSCISIDQPGNYFVSCANDFHVSIFGIGSDEYNQNVDLRSTNQPAKSQGSGVSKKEEEGWISAISWQGPYIAFTNETGTKYMTGWANTICICGISAAPHSKTSPSVRPNTSLPVRKYGQILHRWILQDFFVAGISYTLPGAQDQWTTSLDPYNNSQLSGTANGSANAGSTAKKWREIIAFGIKVTSNETDEHNGIPFDSMSSVSTSSVLTTATTAMLLNLTSSETQSNHQHKTSAQLLIIRPIPRLPTPGSSSLSPPAMNDYQLMAEDAIEMRHAEPKYLNRFLLAALPRDNMFFLMGTRELIEAHPCSIDNRVSWFLENGLYADAVECAMRNKDFLQETSVLEVGKKLIDHLIEQGDFEAAASYLPKICARHKEEWEIYVDEFEKHHQILKLVPVIPTKEPKLEPECYEAILTAALVGGLIDKTIRRIADDNSRSSDSTKSNSSPFPSITKEDLTNLYQSLAHLFVYARQFDKAVTVYMLLKDQVVFRVIDQYNLFNLVKDKIVELMEVNTDLAVRLLLSNRDSIPASDVVTQLSKQPRLQMAYLNQLLNLRKQSMEMGGKKDDVEIRRYSDMLIRLYADHDRSKLLPFLKRCENYQLDLALDICKRKQFVEEAVYLLGRSGNRMEALDVIVQKLGRIEYAVDFCTDHSDKRLWNSSACSFVDPLSVVEKIPEDMEIPSDSELQVKLLKDSHNVGALDVVNLFKRRIKPVVAEVRFETFCVEKKDAIIYDKNSAITLPTLNSPSTTISPGEVRLFGCGHALHTKCLEESLTRSSFTIEKSASNSSLAIPPGSSYKLEGYGSSSSFLLPQHQHKKVNGTKEEICDDWLPLTKGALNALNRN